MICLWNGSPDTPTLLIWNILRSGNVYTNRNASEPYTRFTVTGSGQKGAPLPKSNFMGLSPKSMSIAILVLFVAAATACGTDRGSPTTGPAAAFGSEPTVSSNDTVPTSQSTATPVPTVYPTLESRRAPTPTPRAYIEINPTIKSFPDIPPPKGPNLEPPYLGGDEILKRIGEFAPTFGGLYMYEGNLVIIINDDTQIDRAVAAIAAYYGPDRITDTVLIERGRYDFKQLSAWYRIANDLVWNLGGVSSSHIDEMNRMDALTLVS